MLTAIFLFLLFLAAGAGCLFVAFNTYSRHEPAKRHWLWRFVKNREDEEAAESYAMAGPLIAWILIISGAAAVFLIRLLA